MTDLVSAGRYGSQSDVLREVKRFPERYPIDPLTGLRRIVYGAYLIFYRVGADGVDVARIIHSVRDYAALFDPNDTG